MGGLRTTHAQSLYRVMLAVRRAFKEAQAKYHSAFDLTMDITAHPDGDLTFRREGRALAQALSTYNDATMAWLAFVDAQAALKSLSLSVLEHQFRRVIRLAGDGSECVSIVLRAR